MHGWSCHKAGTRAGAGLVACALTAFMLVTGAGSAQAAGPVWKLAHSPNATLPGGQLESVSCSSAGACTAVGTDRNTAGIGVTLAERWNGKTWQRQHTPNPAEDTAASVTPDLHGVSCPAAGFCAAVGSYNLAFGQVSIAQVWNGHGWASQRFPVPLGAFSASLDQVSCTSPRFCEAVGTATIGGRTVTLAAAWNGTSWHLQHTPNPPGSTFVQLHTVSCASLTFCEAWGGGNSANGGPELAEQWNGSSWRLQTVPPNVTVNSVSCVSATVCEAVGNSAAFAWNGSSWTAQTLPSPADSAGLAGGVVRVADVLRAGRRFQRGQRQCRPAGRGVERLGVARAVRAEPPQRDVHQPGRRFLCLGQFLRGWRQLRTGRNGQRHEDPGRGLERPCLATSARGQAPGRYRQHAQLGVVRLGRLL